MSDAATITMNVAQRDEADLVERIRAGDQRASEALVRRFGPRMRAVARRFFRNEEDSADAVQDAFLSAYQSLDSFAGKAVLSTWLHRIVVNVCLMKLRRQKKEQSIESPLPRFDQAGHQAHRPVEWDDAVQRAEVGEHVRMCIDRLPEPYRTVLVLRDIEEVDTFEAARRIDCTTNNVKVRLHRARQALRTLLEPSMI